MKNKKEFKLHFVGIGGIGMSGIAEVFLNQGYAVSGSDLSESETTKRLQGLGAKLFKGHAASNVDGVDVVIISSAVKKNNPEVLRARELRVPVIPRAEMLGELMRQKTGVAVAGSHGKTTTTSLLASVLTHAKTDPTVVIGGKVNALGSNARLGQGQVVVAEADESDGSFLQLPCSYAIITNIDDDHLDHYKTLAGLEDAFVQFESQLPFYGLAAVCADDTGIMKCLSRFTKPFVTYGFSKDADYYAEQVEPLKIGAGSKFKAWGNKKLLGEITIHIPGKHNVLNALGVLAISEAMGLDFKTIQEGLAQFKGVGRRFEICFQDTKNDVVVVDDYGHHPSEVVATLGAARQFWNSRRIVTVFQPHRYSRTVHCRDGFLQAFVETDILLLCDIYAAGEEPIAGVDSESLAEDIKRVSAPGKDIRYVGGIEQAKKVVLEIVEKGDLVLCLGAGSITKLAHELAVPLKTHEF